MRLLLVLLLSGCTTLQVDTLTNCSWDELSFLNYTFYLNVNCSDTESRANKKKSTAEKLID